MGVVAVIGADALAAGADVDGKNKGPFCPHPVRGAKIMANAK